MRRAEKRGKELPLLLKAALEAQADGKLLVTSEQDFQSAGFIGKASPSAGNIGFEEEVGATLKAEQVTHVIESVPADNCKCLTSWDYKNKRVFDENGSYPCMSSGKRSGADFTAVLQSEILDMAHTNDVVRECGEVSPTLQTRMSKYKKQHSLVFQKAAHPRSSEEPQVWNEADVAHTLNTFSYNENRCDELVVEPTYCIQGNTIDRSDTAGANGKGVIEGKSYTLNTVDRPAVAYAVGIQPNNSTSAGGLSDIEEKPPTLSCTKKTGVAACYPINTQIVTRSNKLGEGTGMGIGDDGDPAYTLQAAHSHGVIFAIDRAAFNQGANAQYDFQIDDSGINSTIVAKGPSAVCYGVVSKGNGESFLSEERHTSLACGGGQAGQGYPCTLQSMDCGKLYVWIVRRLTPRECERLQGYPDDWTKYDTKCNEIKDTPRYKACGNSIAIPCAARVFRGIVEAENAS